MIKLKDLLVERVDYHELASELVRSYGLKSKIKFGSSKTFGEYVPEKDLITLRPSYRTIKEFLLTINWITLGSIVVIIGSFLGICLLVAIILHFLINRIFGYSGNKDLDYKDKVTAKAKELFNRYKH